MTSASTIHDLFSTPGDIVLKENQTFLTTHIFVGGFETYERAGYEFFWKTRELLPE
jgi:hypothetical protein